MDNSLFSPKTMFSPKTRQKPGIKKSTRFSISGKSVQSTQIVLKSSFHNVERFGNTLPVIVTEALTFVDRNVIISVRISDCGFAWLVCGRRLLIWQYRQSPNATLSGTPQRRAQGSQCFELILPPSDLVHRAELVSVFLPPGSHSPACIAVSPEGVIRYWPNVSHEGVSVEQTVDLQGQECDSLCALGGKVDGCVLATTTCTVILVQPKLIAGGRHSLHCHTLRTPTGWLGGIGKRMSSLIFGSMTTEQSGETRLVRVLSSKQSEDCWHVYVLAGQSLQKWVMSANEPERLESVAELGRAVRDAYQSTTWESCGSDPIDIDLWLHDMQVVGNNIMLLSAAVNLHVSPQVHYALIRLDANALQPAVQIEEFLLLKKLLGSQFTSYQEIDSDYFSYRLLLCDDDYIFLYTQQELTVIQAGNEPDIFNFTSIGDKILGGSVCFNTAVFFTQNHGMVAVYPGEQSILGDQPRLLTTSAAAAAAAAATSDYNTSLVNKSMTFTNVNVTLPPVNNNLSLYNIDPEEIVTAQKDIVSQVKAAFLFHVKKQQDACNEILVKLFPEEGESKNEIDNVLDKIVLEISSELLDDIPSRDPRWLNENGTEHTGLGSSESMQIQHQLEDKQQAQNIFLMFLQQTGLWSRLSAITVENAILATLHVFADHSEYLIAAMQLKNLSTTNSQLLQKAIDLVVQKLYETPKHGLTKQDIFYRQVTKIRYGLWALIENCIQCATSDTDPSNIISMISETNNIILSVLSTVIQFRQQKSGFFSPNISVAHLPVEYLPWTMSTDEYGVYESLNKQQSLTLRYGARVCTEGATRASLYDQYVSLVDLMLDARKCHVESVKSINEHQTQRADMLLRQYQQERHKLIQPLVKDNEWERAALLAEKYLDFTSLIIICENTNNQKRLDEYLERFKNENFAQHVFNWYVQEGKQGKLLARCRAAATASATRSIAGGIRHIPTAAGPSSSLTKFLGAHPQLKWLQHAFSGDYEKTSQTLSMLANDEKDSLTRKKSMLSVAKLANFVANGISNETDTVEFINRQLDLIQIQENVPDDVLTTFGYDAINQPIIDPVMLAHLCVCPENQEATEYDFRKALEVTNYIESLDQRNEVILNIWSTAILRDTIWTKPLTGLESPLEVLRNTMFYKLIDLTITLDTNAHHLLPPIESLLNTQNLESLKNDTNFQYLIKVGYDYFYRTQSEM